MPKPPPPRNAIEIPLFACATWGVWPPLNVLLGLPYLDLEERLRPSAQHVVVAGNLRGHVAPDPEALAHHSSESLSRAAQGVDFVLETDRLTRRGPKRGPASMQLIPDIGVDQPAAALAWMLAWRDLAIVGGGLGVSQLKDQACSWFRNVDSKETAIRKQKERIREYGGDLTPRWSAVEPEASARNAIIAARGTAARLGGDHDLEELLSQALERYRVGGLDPATVLLPPSDSYRYHPDVRELARFFVAPGAPPVEYGPEYTHRVLRRRRP
jgi:hypothetical protein